MAFADSVQIQSGQVPSGATNSGNPVKVGAVYNSAAPSPSSGQVVDAQADSAGNLKVNVVNGATSGTAGTPSTSVISVQGLTGMTPVQTTPYAGTTGGALYNNAIAPATPAVTTVKSSAGNVVGITAFNSLATPVFLKLFDVSGTITLGTTAATYQYMIPGNTGGAGFALQLPFARSHANSIKYAVTLNIALNDNTSMTANSVVVDVSYN